MRRVKDPRRTKIHCEFDSHQRYLCRSGGIGIRVCFKHRILRVQLPPPVLYAQVAKFWQTCMTQPHVPVQAYGFDSRPGYFAVMPQRVMGRERPSEARSPRRGKTGDPRKRTGGSSPSHSAMETWLKWQKHFPAKEGPGDRHVGSRPTVSAQMSPAGITRNFIPEV